MKDDGVVNTTKWLTVRMDMLCRLLGPWGKGHRRRRSKRGDASMTTWGGSKTSL
jgi:hypothetical protein